MQNLAKNKNVEIELNATLSDYVPVSKISDVCPYITSAAIRQHIFYNTRDFKGKVLRLFGKRQFIKISALKDWIEETNGGQVA